MKNVLLIFFVLLLTNSLYSQINVVARPTPGDKYQFFLKNSGAKANEFLWEEIEGFVNGYAKATANNLWILVDGNGHPISTKRYEAVRNFCNKLAATKSENKWGFIDEKGNLIVPFDYDIIFDFKEAVTGAYKNNKWYLVNRQGVVTKTLDVDIFYGFKNGIAKISKQGRSGTMNLNGDIVSIEPLKNTTPITTPFNANTTARPESAPCPPNIDFELGNFTNWNCFTGSVSSSGTTNVITVLPSAPTATRHEIYTAPFGLDPYGLFSITPPDGSGKALKLGNNINGARAERVTYQLNIPSGSTDASITYRYAVVFQDPGHFTYEQPRFSAKLRDVVTNTYLPCASYEYVADSTLPGFFDSPIDDTVKCKNWASVFINLSAYAGRTLDLEFTTADCTRGAHWGYAYVDVGDCNIAANISYQCSPSVATVNAPPGFQFYNWWNSNFTTILATGQNATISPIPAFNSVLHVEVIPYNGYGCRDTLDVLVTNSYPLADAGPDKITCVGASTTLGTSAVAGNTYSWSPSAYLSNATISNPIANPPISTTYYLTVTNPANSCPKIDTVNIVVNPKPIPAFSQPANQCLAGNSFTFNNTSTGAATYFWTFGDGTNSTLQNPTHVYTSASNYTVQLVVTSSNGCKDSMSRSFSVFPKPIPAFSQPANQCLRNNVFVFANTSTGGASYLWNFGDSTISTDFTPTHTYSNAGYFTVKLIVTNTNGCKESTTRSFNVNQSPNISIQNNHAICLGDSVQLSTIGAQIYQWNPSVGLSCSTCPNPMATPTANTTYTLTGLSNLGCIASATINIIVRQPIKILASPNKAVCGKSSTNLFAVGATSYVWSPAAGLNNTNIANPVASPDTTTRYMVIGYDANNCFKDTGYVKITVNPIPAIELGPDVTLPTGTIYPIRPLTISGPIVSWTWAPAINLSCSNCPNPIATVKNNITYRAIVKNIYGCTAIDTLRIHTLCNGSQVFVPNAFTPDGDGRNDKLVVNSSGINAIKSFKIYSRWGELLFEKYNFPPNNPAFGWDGKIKGQTGSAEVYVYILEVTCDNNEKLSFKGNITLLN